MPTFNSTQFGRRPSISGAGVSTPGRDVRGRVRMAYADIVVPSGAVDGDNFRLFTLPKGARPIRFIHRHGAYGTSVTSAIGVTGTAGMFVTAAAAATAATKNDLSATFAPAVGEEHIVLLTLAGANPTAGITAEIICEYVID